MTMIQHRDPGDESEAAMTDERAAVERFNFDWQPEEGGCNCSMVESEAGEYVRASDYDALRAENERLKVENASLKEANEIDLGEKAPIIFENTALSARVSELTRLLGEAEKEIRFANAWMGEMRAIPHPSIWGDSHAVQRALQSGEGKEPSR